MKLWPAILALGFLALVAGIVMFGLRLHRTIGLGALGLGVVLIFLAVAMALVARRNRTQSVSEPGRSPVKKSGLLKALIAILVVVGIGIATFYGTSYVSNLQPGNTQASSGSIGSVITESGPVSTASPTASASTFVVSVSTQASTSETVSNSLTSNSQTSSNSQSVSNSQSSSTQTTLTSQSSTSQSSTSQSASTKSSTSQSFPSSGNFPFDLTSEPTVVLHGDNITINAVYVNTGATTMTVNFYMDVAFANGTDYSHSILFDQSGVQVPSNGQFPINANLGPFLPSSYSITFYVVNHSQGRLSDSVTAAFTTN